MKPLTLAPRSPLRVTEGQIDPGFHGAIEVRYLDGKNWRLLSEFVYCSPLLNTCVRVPVGFETDFASIPKVLWVWLHPTNHVIAAPALIHDILYRTPDFAVTRAEADEVMKEGMVLLGASWLQQRAVYRSLRLFGGGRFVPR